MLECYHGFNFVNHFLRRLRDGYEKIETFFTMIEPIVTTAEQERAFREAVNCNLCDQSFGADRVRDHCHMSGLHRGAVHCGCNLKLKYRGKANSKTDDNSGFDGYMVPVIFHNLKGYDGHFIMKGFKKIISTRKHSLLTK